VAYIGQRRRCSSSGALRPSNGGRRAALATFKFAEAIGQERAPAPSRLYHSNNRWPSGPMAAGPDLRFLEVAWLASAQIDIDQVPGSSPNTMMEPWPAQSRVCHRSL